MSQLLEATELLEHDGVAEVEVRRRGIHAELHAQGSARVQSLLEPLAQLVGAVELDRTLAHRGELSLDLALDRSRASPRPPRPMQAELRHDALHAAIRLGVRNGLDELDLRRRHRSAAAGAARTAGNARS